MYVPLRNKGHQAFCQAVEIGEVENAEPLALQDAEPLLRLVHPRAMGRQKEADKARMNCQPSLRTPSFVNTHVIEDEGDVRHGRRNLSIQVVEQSNELLLALPSPRTSVDLASTRIESRKQMQSICTLVLMLQANVSTRSSRKRRSQPRTRLQIGLLVHTQDEFIVGEGSSIQVNQGPHELGKTCVAGNFHREPQMVSPRFEFVRMQDAPDGFGRNAANHPLGLEVTS